MSVYVVGTQMAHRLAIPSLAAGENRPAEGSYPVDIRANNNYRFSLNPPTKIDVTYSNIFGGGRRTTYMIGDLVDEQVVPELIGPLEIISNRVAD